jgi:hypothetical protein
MSACMHSLEVMNRFVGRVVNVDGGHVDAEYE